MKKDAQTASSETFLAHAKALKASDFAALGRVPPELEWFANLPNAQTRRAYRNDVKDFTALSGLEH